MTETEMRQALYAEITLEMGEAGMLALDTNEGEHPATIVSEVYAAMRASAPVGGAASKPYQMSFGLNDEIRGLLDAYDKSPRESKTADALWEAIRKWVESYTAAPSQGVSEADIIERCANVVDAECDRILSKQSPTQDPMSIGESVNASLRIMACILPDISAAIRALKPTQ